MSKTIGVRWITSRKYFTINLYGGLLSCCFSKDGELDFTAMDSFMEHVLQALRNDGTIAVGVFPPISYAVLSYADRLAQEVVSTHFAVVCARAKALLSGRRIHHAAPHQGARDLERGVLTSNRCGFQSVMAHGGRHASPKGQ